MVSAWRKARIPRRRHRLRLRHLREDVCEDVGVGVVECELNFFFFFLFFLIMLLQILTAY